MVTRLGAVLLVVLACLVPGAARAAEPRVEVDAVGDPRRGHVVVTIRIHDLDADVTTMRVEMFGDGGYDAAYNVTCPRASDPDEAGLTHACEVPMPEITRPGAYRVILTRALSTQQVVEVDVAPFAHEWWTDVEPTFDVDHDDGSTDARLVFPAVPAGELPLDVLARTDADGDGTPDTDGPRLACSPTAAPGDGPVEVVCTSTEPLPPLCVDDPFDLTTCAADRHLYSFVANGHDLEVTHESVHRQRSAYVAGHDAGTADQRAGRPLSGVDLDTFVLGSSDGCRTADLPDCRANGYYTGWLDAFVADWPRAVRHLDVSRDGTRAVVSAAVSALPTGRHGLRLEVAHWPVADPEAVSTVACEAVCDEVVVEDLPPGDHVFALRVVDDHPRVTVVTHDGETQTRGQTVLVSQETEPVPEHEPSAHADLTVDEDLLGRLVVELWDVPDLAETPRVQLSLDGADDGRAWFGETVDCALVDDPARPRVSARCVADIDPAPPTGRYVVTAALQHATLGDVALGDEVELALSPGWWDAPRLVSSATDPFTGRTDLVVELPEAPADTDVDHLELWADPEGSGTPQRRVGTVDCAVEHGVLTCRVENLDPLCTSGPFASTCSGAETFLLVHRGRVVPLPIEASFTQPSRYEEGVFFARDGFSAGTDYAVDDLVLESSAVCAESDETHCYDAGFYTTWLDLLRDRLSSPSFVDAVQVQVGGGSATVVVPRVPQATGAHGVTLHVRRTTPSGVITIHDVDCSGATCQPVVLGDLAPGRHDLTLVARNHHPRVQVTTLDGTEVTWGDDDLVVRTLDPVVVPPAADPAVTGTVRDVDGHPVAGVVVSAEAAQRPAFVAPSALRAPGVASDADGAFRLEVAGEGRHDVTFTDPAGRFSDLVLRGVEVGAGGLDLGVVELVAVDARPGPGPDGSGPDRPGTVGTGAGTLPDAGAEGPFVLLLASAAVLVASGLVLSRPRPARAAARHAAPRARRR